jgi:hypothetical protein
MPPLVKRRTPVLEPVGSHKLVKVPEKELDPEFLMKDPEFVKKYEAVRIACARHACIPRGGVGGDVGAG